MIRLRLTIVQGRNLPVRDMSGSSDPYVKFKFKGQSFKTSVQYATLSPKWNESFIVDVDDLKSSKNTIKFELYDKDTISSDDEMGSFSVNLNDLGSESSLDKWYPVESSKRGEKGGNVRVVLTTVNTGAALPPTAAALGSAAEVKDRSYGYGAPPAHGAYPPQGAYPPPQGAYPPPGYPGGPPLAGYPGAPPAGYPPPQHVAQSYSAYPHAAAPPPGYPQYPQPGVGGTMPVGMAAAHMPSSDSSSDESDSSKKKKKKQKKAVKSVRRVLPHCTDEQVFAALYAHNWNKEAAINSLLTPGGAPPPAAAAYPPPAAAAYPPHAAAAYPPGYGAPVAYNQYIQGPPPMLAPPVYGMQQASNYNHDYNAYTAGGGRRKALLIGINYIGQRSALRGCISDVARMRQLLVGTYGFTQDITSMVCLCDDSPDPKFQPTRHNIIYAMKWLTGDVRTGDVLFFHFSGHGSQVRDKTGTEADGYDEVILPVDHRTAGHIVDDEIHATLVQPLPQGARLTAVMDCCHSGTGMDLPYMWKARKHKWEEDDNPVYTQGDVQLFSGCADSQRAADVQKRGHNQQAGGAVTTAFVEALSRNPFGYKYPSLLQALQEAMWRGGLPQQPQLSSSQRFNLNRNFNLTDIVPNHNQYLGRKYKKKKKMSKKTMLAAGGAGLIGGLLLGELLF